MLITSSATCFPLVSIVYSDVVCFDHSRSTAAGEHAALVTFRSSGNGTVVIDAMHATWTAIASPPPRPPSPVPQPPPPTMAPPHPPPPPKHLEAAEEADLRTKGEKQVYWLKIARLSSTMRYGPYSIVRGSRVTCPIPSTSSRRRCSAYAVALSIFSRKTTLPPYSSGWWSM